jgi:hypothetical protein
MLFFHCLILAFIAQGVNDGAGCYAVFQLSHAKMATNEAFMWQNATIEIRHSSLQLSLTVLKVLIYYS